VYKKFIDRIALENQEKKKRSKPQEGNSSFFENNLVRGIFGNVFGKFVEGEGETNIKTRFSDVLVFVPKENSK